jgi:hypothetical protein
MTTSATIIATELITEHHHYAGLVHADRCRLADVLADHNLRVLEMNQVTLNAIGAQGIELKLEKMLVKKDHVLMAIPKGAYEAPISRANNYRKKDRHSATIVLAGHVLSCVIYLPALSKPWALVDQKSDLPAFFGVTDVTFHSSSHALIPEKCDTAIIRREAIESMEVSSMMLPDRQTAAPLNSEDVLQAIRELRSAT